MWLALDFSLIHLHPVCTYSALQDQVPISEESRCLFYLPRSSTVIYRCTTNYSLFIHEVWIFDCGWNRSLGGGITPSPPSRSYSSISSSRFFNFSTCILLLGNQVRVTSSWGGWLTGGGPGELRMIDRWMIRVIADDWQLRRSVGASLIRSKLLLDPVQIPLNQSQ